MKITIESTTKIVQLNGVPGRVWEGKTDSGIDVVAFITRVAVPTQDDPNLKQFERELKECREPNTVWDARLVL